MKIKDLVNSQDNLKKKKEDIESSFSKEEFKSRVDYWSHLGDKHRVKENKEIKELQESKKIRNRFKENLSNWKELSKLSYKETDQKIDDKLSTGLDSENNNENNDDQNNDIENSHCKEMSCNKNEAGDEDERSRDSSLKKKKKKHKKKNKTLVVEDEKLSLIKANNESPSEDKEKKLKNIALDFENVSSIESSEIKVHLEVECDVKTELKVKRKKTNKKKLLDKTELDESNSVLTVSDQSLKFHKKEHEETEKIDSNKSESEKQEDIKSSKIKSDKKSKKLHKKKNKNLGVEDSLIKVK